MTSAGMDVPEREEEKKEQEKEEEEVREAEWKYVSIYHSCVYIPLDLQVLFPPFCQKTSPGRCSTHVNSPQANSHKRPKYRYHQRPTVVDQSISLRLGIFTAIWVRNYSQEQKGLKVPSPEPYQCRFTEVNKLLYLPIDKPVWAFY